MEVLTRLKFISPARALLPTLYLSLLDAMPILALEAVIVAMRDGRKGKAIAGIMRRAGNE